MSFEYVKSRTRPGERSLRHKKTGKVYRIQNSTIRYGGGSIQQIQHDDIIDKIINIIPTSRKQILDIFNEIIGNISIYNNVEFGQRLKPVMSNIYQICPSVFRGEFPTRYLQLLLTVFPDRGNANNSGDNDLWENYIVRLEQIVHSIRNRIIILLNNIFNNSEYYSNIINFSSDLNHYCTYIKNSNEELWNDDIEDKFRDVMNVLSNFGILVV